MTKKIQKQDGYFKEGINVDGDKLKTKDLSFIDDKKEALYVFEKVDESKRAWLAGLLQAEAYFTADRRRRAKSEVAEYVPPPPIPTITLAMVEEDLMEHYGELVQQNVVILKRKTTANKTLYRFSLTQRDKVERLLKAILPHVVSEKNRTRIIELLKICEEYQKWVEEGGRSNVAKLAASFSHKKRQQYKKSEKEKK